MGLKNLTANNRDQPDEASTLFVRLSPLAGLAPMTSNDWARAFFAVGLAEHVPEDHA